MRIATQVLDGTYGKSAIGVRASLAWTNGDSWRTVAVAETDANGRIEDWGEWHQERGTYRIRFDSDSYFAGLGGMTGYPEIPVIFRIQDELHEFQILVTLSPYAYSIFFETVNDESVNH